MPDIALPELPPMPSAPSLPPVPGVARPPLAALEQPSLAVPAPEPGLPGAEAPGSPPAVVEQRAVEHPPEFAEDLAGVEELVHDDPLMQDSDIHSAQMAALATSEPAGADVQGQEGVTAGTSDQPGEIPGENVTPSQPEALTPSQQLGKVREELTALAQQIQEGMTPENVRRYWDLKYQESQLVALRDATAVDLLRAPQQAHGEQAQATDGQPAPEITAAEIPVIAQALNFLYDSMQRAMTPDDFRTLMNTAGTAIEQGNPPEQRATEQQPTVLKLILKLLLGLLTAALVNKLVSSGLSSEQAQQQVQQLTQNVDAAFTSPVGAEAAQVAAPASPSPVSSTIATPAMSSA